MKWDRLLQEQKTIYYRKLVKKFPCIVRLMRLNGKNLSFKWTEECQHLFEKLKPNDCTHTRIEDLNKLFIIYSDAGYVCIGAVLCQEHEIHGKSQERPIAYVAYQFLTTQLNYAVMGKEACFYHVYKRFTHIYSMPELQWESFAFVMISKWDSHAEEHNFMTFQQVQDKANNVADSLPRPLHNPEMT